MFKAVRSPKQSALGRQRRGRGRVPETPACSHLGPCDPERRLRSRAVRFGALGDGEDRLEWLPNVSLRGKSTGLGARKVKGAAS